MIKKTNELVLTINNCCWCLDNNWCDRMFITRVVNIMSIYIIYNTKLYSIHPIAVGILWSMYSDKY